ncbi:unnamed protein product, partial [Amoebophrya sp. A120]|eukprot:GSA120T00021781001.1
MAPPRGSYTCTLYLLCGWWFPWSGAGELAPTFLFAENATDALTTDRSPHYNRHDDSQQVRTTIVDTTAEFTDEEVKDEGAGESGFVEKSLSGDSSTSGDELKAPSTTRAAANGKTTAHGDYSVAVEGL